MTLNEINLRGGQITYNDFHIDPQRSFDEQIYDYKEDMLQIKFDNKYCIDLGWYPEFEPDGYFVIHVIQNSNWDDPLLIKKTQSLEELFIYLDEVIQFVDQLRKKS